VALLSTRGRFLTAEPFFGPGRRLVVDRVQHARPGDLVLLRLPRPGPARARATRRSSASSAGPTSRATCSRRSCSTAAWRAASRRASSRPPRTPATGSRPAAGADPGAAGRVDLRDLPTFTIDPPTARDFDDAISCEELGPEHWRVWVHIADVAAYVRPGSAIDREALRRGTSVYVPGKVEPMLPRR
jgi:ribonuclease R